MKEKKEKKNAPSGDKSGLAELNPWPSYIKVS